MSSFELAKGFAKPLIGYNAPELVSVELVHALDELIAKRKLNIIMRTKSTNGPHIQAGDLV